MTSEKVLYSDDRAATFKTGISGWVASDGRFWGDDEHMARWSGCTYLSCECGNQHEKGCTICPECRDKKKLEKYQSKEFKEWDGEPLYCDGSDEYFFDEESIRSHCEVREISPSELRLVICTPNHAREIDDDYWCDDLAEDTYLHDIAPEVSTALESLNKLIREQKPVLSWDPGKYRTEIKEL